MNYLILALATWRLSSLLVSESGPWALFVHLRYLAGVRYNGETLQIETTNQLAGAFACIWCMSVWVGLAWWLAWQLWPVGALWLAGPLALSAGAILAERWARGEHHQLEQ